MPQNDNSSPDGDRERMRGSDEGIVISETDARGGEIVLRTRRRRAVFLAGLVGFVVLTALLWFAGLAA